MQGRGLYATHITGPKEDPLSLTSIVLQVANADNLIKWGQRSCGIFLSSNSPAWFLNQWYLHENEMRWLFRSSDVTHWLKFGHLQIQNPGWEHRFEHLIGSWNCELNTLRVQLMPRQHMSYTKSMPLILEIRAREWQYFRSSHRTNGISVRCQKDIGVIDDRHNAVLGTWIANQQHPKPRARLRQTNRWLLVLPCRRHSELQEWCIENWWRGRRKNSWK